MNRHLDPQNPGHAEEWAALYAAGALSMEDHTAFEAHVEGGCAACVAEIRLLWPAMERLLDAVAPLAPRPQVKASLLARVKGSAPSSPPSDQHTSHAGESRPWLQWPSDAGAADLFISRAAAGRWEETGVQGVRVRRLFVDRERDQFTALIRMEPGASYPRHVHASAEECLVLEGELRVGEELLHPGDYQRAPAGSHHGVQSTEGGCLLLIVSSLSDEMD